jgi:hypothetical protein
MLKAKQISDVYSIDKHIPNSVLKLMECSDGVHVRTISKVNCIVNSAALIKLGSHANATN